MSQKEKEVKKEGTAKKERKLSKYDNESKPDKFKRVAAGRTEKLLDAFDRLEATFVSKAMEGTPEQMKAIVDRVEEALIHLDHSRSATSKAKRAPIVL